MYEWQPQRVIELVLGSSLLASIGIASLLSLIARRYAFPRMMEGMIAGTSSGSLLSETFADLCGKMNMRGVDLREATVGNAFSLDNKGLKVVAVSPELVSSMSPVEVEAVISHEISHFENKDSLGKGLARMAQIALAFYSNVHLFLAAVP